MINNIDHERYDNRKTLKDRFCILVNIKRRLIMKERKLSSWVPVLQVFKLVTIISGSKLITLSIYLFFLISS